MEGVIEGIWFSLSFYLTTINSFSYQHRKFVMFPGSVLHQVLLPQFTAVLNLHF